MKNKLNIKYQMFEECFPNFVVSSLKPRNTEYSNTDISGVSTYHIQLTVVL